MNCPKHLNLERSNTPTNHCALQAHKRCLTGAELLASHTLPTTPAQAKWAGTPQLALDSVKETNQVCMSGNAMNVPSVGCIILACVLGLEQI